MDIDELKTLEKSAIAGFAAGLVRLHEQLGMEAVIREMAVTAELLESLQKAHGNEYFGRMAVARHLRVAEAVEQARSAMHPNQQS